MRLACTLGQDDGIDYSLLDQPLNLPMPNVDLTPLSSSSYSFGDGSLDFGSMTGLDSSAPTGGADFWSTLSSIPTALQSLIPGGGTGTPAAGAPSLPPAGATPSVPAQAGQSTTETAVNGGGGFFDPASCADNFCYQDLYDFSQPYPYLIGAGLLGLVLLLTATGKS